ncbi:ABC transporter permease [Nakamurella sp. PAMC28650]|uniref:ABC transporter permease n=1 Tax=Nakamurella sp. PAMC28650 TaxID=2762325 RepID=UPI00164E23A8|nr:ABC transporter permease [Nakamurella sp. PAMC28650]QNK80760.1 ABC transporter permease [Nakamurella sp. PAMC28650]
MTSAPITDPKTPTPQRQSPRTSPACGRSIGQWAERSALPLAWLLLVVVFSILSPDRFLTSGNVTSILGSQSILFMLALAALVPSMVGDIDLSLGATGALAAVVIAVLNVQHGVPVGVACLIAVAVGAACGGVNALFVVMFKTEPFIVTLGTGTFFTGLVFWLANSTTIVGVSGDLANWTFLRQVGKVPVQFYYCVLIMLIIWYVARFTPVGMRALFVGQSRDVAVLSGIKVTRVRVGAFILAGTIAALAGVLYVGTTGSAGPSSVDTFLLPAYAAVFLGATSIQPGRFNALGTGIAVLFLATGVAGLQLLGAQDFAQQLFYGAALVAAVTLSRLVRRPSTR